MRIRRRGTRLAVRGQLTIIAVTIMAVVFLILAAVTQNIANASQQNQQNVQASGGENLAQTAAAWLTNHLNSDPNYIAAASGPFSIAGSYTPPAGVSSITHQFVSEWFQFDTSGHYQVCNTNLVQPCVRFDPTSVRYSTAYNPASTAIPTSLKEENVVATVEVEQGCAGIASGCKDSYYSTTIARRGYYNYLAFTNYATLDPAQYSPLGLVNPGSICQTNNASSGCVPVSYQSNGTPSPNGIFAGGSDTAPVFNGTTDHVTANPGLILSATSNVTLEGWANVPSAGTSGFVSFLGTTLTGYGIGVASGGCICGAPGLEVIALYQMVRWIPTGKTITPGWHQFVLALNSSGQPSIYVDGQLIYSDTGAGPNVPNGSALIGTDGNAGRYFGGPIADVSIYNKTLSASQILDQYNAAAAGTYDAVTVADSPVAWWKLTEPVGATSAQDSSGNGYTGTYSHPVSAVVPGPFAGSGQVVTSASTANNGDSIYGALRTNSPTIYVCDGNTSAFDVPLVQATSAQVMTATQTGCGLPSSATTQIQQVSPMAMPTNVSSLDQAAFPYIFPDGTSFDFTPNGIDISFTGSSSYMTNNWPALDSALTAANTVVLVSGTSVSIQNMAIPASGVLYVNGSVSNVVGMVNGQVTIAAEGNIDVNAQPDPAVGENLYYYCNGQGAVNPPVIASGCTDLLGLDAQGSIAIGPQSYQQTGWAYYGTGSPAGWYAVLSPSIPVTQGTTYNLTGALDSTAVSPANASPYNGEQMIQVVTNAGSYYMQTFQTPGINGIVTSSWTVPSGVSSVQILLDADNISAGAGQAAVWSNVTFWQSGSTANLAAPMANWTGNVTIGSGNGDWNLVPSELPPMVLDAAMTALGDVPGVSNSNGSVYAPQWQTPNPNKQNPECLVDAPTLTLNGAMISQYQGTFGQYLGLYPATNPCLLSGYHKHFFWDSRLAYEQPPFALSSGSGNFVEMGLTEVSRP